LGLAAFRRAFLVGGSIDHARPLRAARRVANVRAQQRRPVQGYAKRAGRGERVTALTRAGLRLEEVEVWERKQLASMWWLFLRIGWCSTVSSSLLVRARGRGGARVGGVRKKRCSMPTATAFPNNAKVIFFFASLQQQVIVHDSTLLHSLVNYNLALLIVFLLPTRGRLSHKKQVFIVCRSIHHTLRRRGVLASGLLMHLRFSSLCPRSLNTSVETYTRSITDRIPPMRC
jgi:hypothetical protein